MEIRLIRKTGFYGMATPLLVKKDQQKWGYLAYDTTKSFQTDAEKIRLQVSLSWLKSQPIEVVGPEAHLFEAVLNPRLLIGYIGMTFLAILLVYSLLYPLFFLPLVALSAVWFWYFSNRAFLLKEVFK